MLEFILTTSIKLQILYRTHAHEAIFYTRNTNQSHIRIFLNSRA